MSRPAGLGRGLAALIPAAAPGESGLLTLPLSSIRPNPRQPRGNFDEAALDELAQSLRSVGMIQPIVVRPAETGRYEIVAGERRYRAAVRANLESVPAVVRQTADEHLLVEALVENLHRADLNPLEEAAAYEQLRDDFGLTHEQLAQRLGKSRSAITNTLRLLSLPAALHQHIARGSLTAGHARALLSLDDASQQERVAARVLAEGLSVRATEELVRQAAPAQPSRQRPTAAARSPYEGLERSLSDALATRVTIRGSAARGRVVIDYSGPHDLDRLLAVLSRGTGEALVSE